MIERLVSFIYQYEIVGWTVLGCLTLIFVIDLAATVKQVAGLTRELKHLDEAAGQIKKVSNELTGLLYDNSIKAKDGIEDAGESIKERQAELKDDIAARKSELENELQQHKERYEESKRKLAGSLSYTQRRIMRAYPKLRSYDYKEAFEEIKEKVNNL